MCENEDNKKQNTSFLYSLNHATSDDFTVACTDDITELKKEKRKDIIRYVLMGIFICAFLISLYSVLEKLSEYREAENFYDRMYTVLDSGDNESVVKIPQMINPLDGFDVANGSGKTQIRAYNDLFVRMRARILSIKSINPDIYGWIVVPGTDNIDYPIMQGDDNDYYLNHEYTYGYLQAGSIFADCHCDRDTNGNFNTVIYGHNMQNGMMFSELIKFMDEDFFNNNKYIYLYTEKGMFTYLIFSAFKADYRYGYFETGFPSAQNFVDFANEMKANSLYQREGVTFDINDRIITLSTCTNGAWTDRYCVQGKLIESYNEVK